MHFRQRSCAFSLASLPQRATVVTATIAAVTAREFVLQEKGGAAQRRCVKIRTGKSERMPGEHAVADESSTAQYTVGVYLLTRP